MYFINYVVRRIYLKLIQDNVSCVLRSGSRIFIIEGAQLKIKLTHTTSAKSEVPYGRGPGPTGTV